MTPITAPLAAFVSGCDSALLPPAVLTRSKALLLDTLGIALRARVQSPAVPSLLRAVDRLGLGRGEARVIGDPNGYAPAGAALVNGALAHALDFDDTHAAGSIHPGAAIVPAALAAAGLPGARADGATLLAAIVAGYETQIRLSLALVPKDHYARGFHPSATCGAFGAAAAAGRVLGLDPAAVESAFGIALSQAAGSMQYLHDGAWTKLFQVGYAAMNGLVAATLAAEGFKGPGEALEGRHGFLQGYAPNPDPARVTEALGTRFETLAVAVKPYPSCRYTHAALDALIALRTDKANNDGHPLLRPYLADADGRAAPLPAAAVEAIEIALPRAGIPLVGAPLAAKRNPRNIVDGQFSMPFTAAVALRTGGLGWDDYPAHLRDPETLALCRRVDIVTDPRVEAEFPANMSAIARVTIGGERRERFVAVPKGEPDNFLSDAELRAKFDSLGAPCLNDDLRRKLAAGVLALEDQTSVPALLALSVDAGCSTATA